jgi:hypothetical protein
MLVEGFNAKKYAHAASGLLPFGERGPGVGREGERYAASSD